MDQLEKNIRQGKEAASFVTAQPWLDAVAKLQANYFRVFVDSKPEDSVAREKAYLKYRALSDIEIELKKVIDNGMIAESEVRRVIRKN